MTYRMSEKRKTTDWLKTNWQLHLEVFRLRNQGWKLQAIGDKFGLSRQRILAMYQKMARLTVGQAEEVERYANYLSKLPIDNTSK